MTCSSSSLIHIYNNSICFSYLSRNYLKSAYSRNMEFRRWMLQVSSLPNLPARQIRKGFEYLVKKAASSLWGLSPSEKLGLHKLISYYRRYWLDTVGTEMLSCWALPDKTNNNSEVQHRWLAEKFGKTHPNLFVFSGYLADYYEEQVGFFGMADFLRFFCVDDFFPL